MVSHHGLAAILPPNVKFNRGDGIESKGGLFSRVSGGPKPPTCVSKKLKNVESPWKSKGPSKVSEWAISMMGWWILEIVSIIRSSMLDVRVSPSPYGWVLLCENQDLGNWYIIGIWPRDLRYARVWWKSWLTLVLGIRYQVSLEETPLISLFEEESWCGILGEEV